MSDAAKPKKDEQNQPEVSPERVFLANDVLPDPVQALLARVEPLDKAIENADIVLDTNVLLLPYGAGANSLRQVIEAFKRLKSEKRLFLSGQVAREFIRNRPSKLSELQQGLSDKMSRYIAIEKLSFPILEGVPEYDQLNRVLDQSSKLKADLAKASSALVKKIRSWEWNDPVNQAYREVFAAEQIIEPPLNKEATLADLLRRQKLQIPPGYKDSAKDDLGIGDLLIWNTLLEIGSKNKHHIVFVSGDEKADWQHRSNGVGFLPRYELMDEFRRASSGKCFYIIQLSTLLELLKVEKSSIEEIKKEEARIQEATTITVDCPLCKTKVQAFLAVNIGASALPTCPSCQNRFHIHRTREGVITHTAKLPSKPDIDSTEVLREKVACPGCKLEVEGDLGTYLNATSWCRCANCEAVFPIHRRADGSVLVSNPRSPR